MFLVGNVEAQSVPRDATIKFYLADYSDLTQAVEGSFNLFTGSDDPSIIQDETSHENKAFLDGLRFAGHMDKGSSVIPTYSMENNRSYLLLILIQMKKVW